jgi:hypothetical protein
MSHFEHNEAIYSPIDSSDSSKMIIDKREPKTVNYNQKFDPNKHQSIDSTF